MDSTVSSFKESADLALQVCHRIRQEKMYPIFFLTVLVSCKESRLERNANIHVGVKLEIGKP